jgi:hypothetical protein
MKCGTFELDIAKQVFQARVPAVLGESERPSERISIIDLMKSANCFRVS